MTYRELGRRHRAAAITVARTYGVNLSRVIAQPQLAGWATALFIEANKQGVKLPAEARLHELELVLNGRK